MKALAAGLIFCAATAMATEVAEVVVKNFKTAEYNEKNNRLEYILSGKNARTSCTQPCSRPT